MRRTPESTGPRPEVAFWLSVVLPGLGVFFTTIGLWYYLLRAAIEIVIHLPVREQPQVEG